MPSSDPAPATPVEPWLAGLLSLFVAHGVGHAYAGRITQAYVLVGVRAVLFVGLIVFVATVGTAMAVLGAILVFGLWDVLVALNAVRLTREARDGGYLTPGSGWHYAPIGVAGIVVLWGGLLIALSTFTVHGMFDLGMEPLLLPGDYYLANTRAYDRRSPRIDDLVMFEGPSGETRVARCLTVDARAVTVAGARGRFQTAVPHDRVIGRPLFVVLSVETGDATRVRWGRIGTTLK